MRRSFRGRRKCEPKEFNTLRRKSGYLKILHGLDNGGGTVHLRIHHESSVDYAPHKPLEPPSLTRWPIMVLQTWARILQRILAVSLCALLPVTAQENIQQTCRIMFRAPRWPNDDDSMLALFPLAQRRNLRCIVPTLNGPMDDGAWMA